MTAESLAAACEQAAADLADLADLGDHFIERVLVDSSKEGGEVDVFLRHGPGRPDAVVSLDTAVLLDVGGEHVRLPVERVAELVGLSLGDLTVKWWFTPDDDLVCGIAYSGYGWEKHTYFLDALTAREADTVTDVLLGEVRARPGRRQPSSSTGRGGPPSSTGTRWSAARRRPSPCCPRPSSSPGRPPTP